MLDLTWGEIGIIAVVAIVVIGPKDLPVVLRTAGKYLKKAKAMMNEIKTSFNEALAEDEIQEMQTKMKKDLRQIIDLEGNLQDAYDVEEIKPLLKPAAGPLPNPLPEGEGTDRTPLPPLPLGEGREG